MEKDAQYCKELEKNVDSFIKDNQSLKDKIDVKFFQDDYNKAINDILSQLQNDKKYPLFILIDTTGL